MAGAAAGPAGSAVMTGKDGAVKIHLGVRGLFQSVSVPACGAWSREVTDDPKLVRCDDCRATFDFVMAGGGQ